MCMENISTRLATISCHISSQDWERYQHIPLAVLAHSTHMRGSGVMENGVEKPNVKVTLASQIPPEDCEQLNLGYLDPASINIEEWQNREDEGILYVPKAGEILYRLKGARVMAQPQALILMGVSGSGKTSVFAHLPNKVYLANLKTTPWRPNDS